MAEYPGRSYYAASPFGVPMVFVLRHRADQPDNPYIVDVYAQGKKLVSEIAKSVSSTTPPVVSFIFKARDFPFPKKGGGTAKTEAAMTLTFAVPPGSAEARFRAGARGTGAPGAFTLGGTISAFGADTPFNASASSKPLFGVEGASFYRFTSGGNMVDLVLFPGSPLGTMGVFLNGTFLGEAFERQDRAGHYTFNIAKWPMGQGASTPVTIDASTDARGVRGHLTFTALRQKGLFQTERLSEFAPGRAIKKKPPVTRAQPSDLGASVAAGAEGRLAAGLTPRAGVDLDALGLTPAARPDFTPVAEPEPEPEPEPQPEPEPEPEPDPADVPMVDPRLVAERERQAAKQRRGRTILAVLAGSGILGTIWWLTKK